VSNVMVTGGKISRFRYNRLLHKIQIYHIRCEETKISELTSELLV